MQWSSILTTTPLANVGGTAIYGLKIPLDASLAGVLFFNQAFVTDPPANPGGLTVSNAGVGRMGY